MLGELYVGVLSVSSNASVKISGLTITRGSDTLSLPMVSNDGMLSLVDSTIRDGSISAISNRGSLSLLRSTVGPSFGKGNAPISNAGVVTLVESRIVGNYNSETVGAISNSADGTVRMQDSVVAQNSGYVSVVTNAGTMTIVDLSVDGNGSNSAPIRNSGTLRIVDSTVIHNASAPVSHCFDACAGGIHLGPSFEAPRSRTTTARRAGDCQRRDDDDP